MSYLTEVMPFALPRRSPNDSPIDGAVGVCVVGVVTSPAGAASPSSGAFSPTHPALAITAIRSSPTTTIAQFFDFSTISFTSS